LGFQRLSGSVRADSLNNSKMNTSDTQCKKKLQFFANGTGVHFYYWCKLCTSDPLPQTAKQSAW
jgi:hypothetical protein